jgi:hypothetical protein
MRFQHGFQPAPPYLDLLPRLLHILWQKRKRRWKYISRVEGEVGKHFVRAVWVGTFGQHFANASAWSMFVEPHGHPRGP